MPLQPGQDSPPRRFPLVVEPSNRDQTTAKDAKLINCYVEKGEGEGEYWVYKRAGLLEDATLSETGNGRGAYNWRGSVYTIFGTTAFKDGVSIGTVDGTNGVYRWDSCLGSTPKLLLGNGVEAYTYDSGAGLVNITDADFPSSFVKGWAYLDGTNYVMTPTAHIQGDDLNTPQTWDPLNDLIAQIEPDLGVALAKQLVYVIAMKGWSTEVFYDAANAVGSPLGTVQGAKINYGCVSADSVQDCDGTLLWICTNRESSPQVIAVTNLKGEIVSTKAIERLLAGCDFTSVFSFVLKLDGHSFYVITMKNSNLTLAYDLKDKMWAQWTDTSGNYLPIVAATFNSSMQHLLQHETNGKMYLADMDYTSDDGSLITVDIYTPNSDMGTRRRKACARLEVIGDQVPGSVIQIRTNDQDFKAGEWTNFREVDMSIQRPYLSNMGTFVRRAKHLRHRCNTKMRIQAVELDLDLGAL